MNRTVKLISNEEANPIKSITRENVEKASYKITKYCMTGLSQET